MKNDQKTTIKRLRVNLRQLVQLAQIKSLSNREVSRRSGYHPSKVKAVRDGLPFMPWGQEEYSELTESELARYFFPSAIQRGNRFREPDLVQIAKALATKISDRTTLYERYSEEEAQGKKMSERTFRYRIEAFLNKPKLVLWIDRAPGEAMQVDFAGMRPWHIEAAKKINIFCDLFVATIGNSSNLFAYAVPNQSTKSWLSAHVAAVEFYGGIARFWICDNLRAAITKARKGGDFTVSEAYAACARHYGAIVEPARPRSPRDKGQVEAGVKIVQRLLQRSLNAKPCFSFEELQERIRTVVDYINNRPIRALAGATRAQLFEEIDRPALLPLPAVRFETFEGAREVLVGPTYIVDFDGSKYTVPHTLVGCYVNVHASSSIVSIEHDGREIARHVRLTQTGALSRYIAHMPQNHAAMFEDLVAVLDEKLKTLPISIATFVLNDVTQSRVGGNRNALAKQALKLISMYDVGDLTLGVELCLQSGANRIGSLKRALETQAWNITTAAKNSIALPQHANIRGAQYFENLIKNDGGMR